ncbi:hypothetical protein EUZ85_15770 [Hahella sp. KA22]|uniref:hypothetical protein n=1 Tax=Hahella sp. KA22 TaxID=1628392 RepID=UPI000FDDD9AC|nr:hypothetical protein [Hahella sp. KA22]AZZ92106.1 hypothetical protein ENC22_13205 [Hahella sp. KA22]QAY55476.1 hypothetical protein EUZ85_15770 [Hahella sp. KA22]
MKKIFVMMLSLSFISFESRAGDFDKVLNTFFSVSIGSDLNIEGETIDYFTGDVRWSVREALIPGGGGLDLSIYRSYNFADHGKGILGDWSLDVPRASFVLKISTECDDNAQNGGHCWNNTEISGITVELPGRKPIALILRDGKYVSVRGEPGWSASLNKASLTAYSPDGKAYLFDQGPSSDGPMNFSAIHQFPVYVSSVTDAHGNWIKYKYHRKVSNHYFYGEECMKGPLLKGDREQCEGSEISAMEHVFPKLLTRHRYRHSMLHI